MVRRCSLVLVLLCVSVVSVSSADGPPAYTEIDKLRLEVAALKHEVHRARTERDQCRLELAPLRVKRDEDGLREVDTKLKADLEAAHPGYVFNAQTGQLEPKPADAKSPHE